jgi:hypothetical protein
VRADRLPLGFLLHDAVRHLLPDGCALQMSIVRRGRCVMDAKSILFFLLFIAALIGWKMLLRKFWPRGKE